MEQPKHSLIHEGGDDDDEDVYSNYELYMDKYCK
jgi:hypothetical protein